jgi:hypothetical protein
VARTGDENDLDRRNFLKCLAWVGTGAVWTLSINPTMTGLVVVG